MTSRTHSDGRITLAHGGGGELMGHLIQEHILSALGNPALDVLTDGAVLRSGTSRIVLTTDSFVVQPLEFPGGDIGRLAVCGTVNDLAVMGGRPLALSLGLIIEEGLEIDRLDRMLRSIAGAASEAGVAVVTGDTKVIERSTGGGLMLNTAGVAALDDGVHLGFDRVRAGDVVLINGPIGDHGMAVMSVRHGLEFETEIVSDAAPLNGLIQSVLLAGIDVHFMRDATRGGLAGVLADVSERTGMSMEVHESRIPFRRATRAAAEMLGFDLLSVANEGKVVLVVGADDAGRCLSVLRQHALGRQAAAIGTLAAGTVPMVELVTTTGGRRVVQRPYGEELPRIC
ncbi:MAG: hydrogenase expression/formation protein HypE [Planctomycetes bacterium]|nr:hydrogenase expression/formation protein HypE [Planctomycetota bacterium]